MWCGSLILVNMKNKEANGILCSIKDKKVKTSWFWWFKKKLNHVDDDFVFTILLRILARREKRVHIYVFVWYGVWFRWCWWRTALLDTRAIGPNHFQRATYIVNSGFGLHSFIIFQKPVPYIKSIHKVNTLKHEITEHMEQIYKSRDKMHNIKVFSRGLEWLAVAVKTNT